MKNTDFFVQLTCFYIYISEINCFFFVFFKFKMKTVSVALILCLNVGVDPPDVVKTQPCARLECWIGKFFCKGIGVCE